MYRENRNAFQYILNEKAAKHYPYPNSEHRYTSKIPASQRSHRNETEEVKTCHCYERTNMVPADHRVVQLTDSKLSFRHKSSKSHRDSGYLRTGGGTDKSTRPGLGQQEPQSTKCSPCYLGSSWDGQDC